MSFAANKTSVLSIPFLKLKFADYAAFIKFRLNMMVVLSAVFGYLIGTTAFSWSEFLSLIIGGFLITASSNGANEIIERSYDSLMERTKSRPLPTARMSVAEGYTIVSLTGVAGLLILWHLLNPLCGILGFLAFFLYVFVYTPLKRISPISVLVGAFPGAIPPMLGWVAATGYFDLEAGILFAIQFVWQFPHFWSIAWVSHDDYQKAGFKMLPSKKGKDRTTSFLVLFYTLMLIPVSLLPVMFGLNSWIAGLLLIALGTFFLIPAIKLHRKGTNKYAKKVMFASFLYLPVMLIILFIDKI